MLDQQKKTTTEYAVYFDKGRNMLTRHMLTPLEMISTTNDLGEMKIYYPKTNQVKFQRVKDMSSKSSPIYYFANNLTDHLGLADEGFTLVERKYEDNFLVTLWKAPQQIQQIDRVKMVFEMANPIYAEYLEKQGKVVKKIYYLNYQDLYTFKMPLKIIEIAFKPNGDSIVNRTIFSNIEVSNAPKSEFFNFKIPDNAIPLQAK